MQETATVTATATVTEAAEASACYACFVAIAVYLLFKTSLLLHIIAAAGSSDVDARKLLVCFCWLLPLLLLLEHTRC